MRLKILKSLRTANRSTSGETSASDASGMGFNSWSD